MTKFKEILKEKSTWSIGLPSLVIGAMTILDADHANEVAATIQTAGQHYTNSGDWAAALGWLGAGLLGIFMTGRK